MNDVTALSPTLGATNAHSFLIAFCHRPIHSFANLMKRCFNVCYIYLSVFNFVSTTFFTLFIPSTTNSFVSTIECPPHRHNNLYCICIANCCVRVKRTFVRLFFLLLLLSSLTLIQISIPQTRLNTSSDSGGFSLLSERTRSAQN